MAHRYGAIPGVGITAEQQRHGRSDNGAASQNDSMLATGFNAVSFQQFDDACRGCRLESGKTEAQVSRIDGVKPVNIF